MNPSISPEQRNRADIILDLERLTREEGFLYTFCALVANSLFFPATEAAEIDWHERLNTQELSYLLGLMVKNPINEEHLPTLHDYQRQFDSARRLMAELQETYFSNAISRIINNTMQTTMPDEANTSDFNDETMVEAMFYGSNSAHDISYLEMAANRYKHDVNWIYEYLGATPDEVISIVNKIKELTAKKYNNLDYSKSFHEYCHQLLYVFTFRPGDISKEDNGRIIKCFAAFTSIPGQTNGAFNEPGQYNTVQSHPLIKLSDNRFFVPVVFDLTESIYLSPFYWMREDDSYWDRALQNRGKATERMALEYIVRVFGKENVYNEVIVKKGKQQVAEIDVLVVYRNKAIVVQAKSKKLTIEARVGNVEALKRDFEDAVQKAFEQGLKCRNVLLANEGFNFQWNSRSLDIPDSIDDVFIVCLTGDDYPALASQFRKYLRKSEQEPYPVAINIFDLIYLAHYLSVPIDFLYYLRQRSQHSDYFYSDSELSFLAFHLAEGITRRSDADKVFLDPNSYFQMIETHYLVARRVYPEIASSNEFVWRWRDPDLDSLVQKLNDGDFEKCVDASFFLFDIYGPDARNLVAQIRKVEQQVLRDGGVHTASFIYGEHSENRGISVVIYPREQLHRTREFESFAMARKYRAKADEWIVMGSIAGSSDLIDSFWYSNERWKSDSDLERLASAILRESTIISIDDE